MSTPVRNSRSKAYWLVTTEHLKKGLWFRDDEDYRVGMNYVAIASFVYEVMVLAFVLMSNHVHFVLYCTEEEARAFINEFKADCSRHLALKYGVRDLLRRNRVVIERISPDDESFERALAYVQMNPPAANICLSPSGYPWGTGGVFSMGCGSREPAWEACPGMQSGNACVPSGLFPPTGSSERTDTSSRNPMSRSNWWSPSLKHRNG